MTKLLSSLNVGDTIEIEGNPAYKYYWGDTAIWKVADKNHAGYPVNSVTLITELRFAYLIAADGKELDNPDSNRQLYGNNRYPYTNIHQWLNSSAGPGKWYTPQHEFDAPPMKENISDGTNIYYDWAGWLMMCGEVFAAKLLTTTLTVAKADIDGGGARLPVPYSSFPYVATSLSSYRAGSGGSADADLNGTSGSRGTAASAYPTLNLAAPMLYGGGGGGGGSAFASYSYGSKDYSVYNAGGAASHGSPGLIIIEKGKGV